jgi:hypothetical protein
MESLSQLARERRGSNEFADRSCLKAFIETFWGRADEDSRRARDGREEAEEENNNEESQGRLTSDT